MFKALRYLFKSSTQEIADVQKYFSREDAETVKNIYADSELESFVEIETIKEISEGNTIIGQHRLSKTSVTNVDDIKLASALSEFINYRLLFNFSQFGDYEDANVFDIFKREFFPIWTDDEKNAPYEMLNDDEIATYEPIKDAINKIYTFEEWYNSLEKTLKNLRGKKSIAKKSGRIYSLHSGSPVYNEFKKELKIFNDSLESELNAITRIANDYLNDFLKIEGISFKFEFEVPIAPDKENERYWNLNQPVVKLVLKYKEDIIKRPHVFLNEARLTALAFPIRLAVFNHRFKTEEKKEGLKIFVLDDILMSMDMSNRYLFFDFILNNKDLKDYQKIILTHERDLYDMLVKMIEVYPSQKKEGWKQFELYENGLKKKDEKDEYENPTILTESLNHYDKAKAFFKQKDYPSCGNYQRKAAENEIKRILKSTKYILTGKERTQEVDTLYALFERLETFCEKYEFDFSPFQKLGIFSKIVLNKLSHDNLRSPIFRDELNEVFEILSELKNLKRLIIAKESDQLIFEKQSQKAGDKRLYKLVVQLTGDLILYHQAASESNLRERREATTELVEPVVKPIEFYIDSVNQDKLAKTKKIDKIHQDCLGVLAIPEADILTYKDEYKIEKDGTWVSLTELIATTISQ
jgi:hypothetical protein